MTNTKENLLNLKQELSTRVTKIDKGMHNRKTSSNFSEQAVGRQNDDVLLNLKNEAKQELALIDKALLKLEQGVYGKCEKCHKDIHVERLEALPFAADCSKCAGLG